MKTLTRKSIKSLGLLLAATALTAGLSVSPKVGAQDHYIGEIIMFGGNFAIRNFALCDGQLMQIISNTALFSLLGTTYGGDGRTTFALPDLRGRTAIHPGSGPGLSTYRLGEKGGMESVTLTQNQMPSHTHAAEALSALLASSMAADSTAPGNKSLGHTDGANIYSAAVPDRFMAEGAVVTTVTNSDSGGDQSHENRMPYLGINHLIVLNGIFPSRN